MSADQPPTFVRVVGNWCHPFWSPHGAQTRFLFNFGQSEKQQNSAAKHEAHKSGAKDGMILNKTFKWHNCADMLWWHLIITRSFLENVPSFLLLWFSPFAVSVLEHVACTFCFLLWTVGSQTRTITDSRQCCQTNRSSQMGAPQNGGWSLPVASG